MILGSESYFRNWLGFWEMVRFLGSALDSGNCYKFWELVWILVSASGFLEMSRITGSVSVFLELF